MKISSLKRKHILWFHIIFWTIELFIGFSYYIFSPNEIPKEYYYGRIFSSIMWIGAFYIAYGLFFPILSRKEKLVLKVIKITFVYSGFLALDSFFIKVLNVNYFGQEPLTFSRYLLNAFTYTTSYMIMGLIFRMAINGIQAMVLKTQLEKQNLKSELALLRSQINPHFLFNTLNNMHSFTHTDPDKTAFSIIKLSEIMRFMLNESNSDRVFLEQEIEYIKSYIALQNIRFSETDYVHFEIEGNPTGILVAPMIFVPFVENAFKHGDKRQKAPGIQVYLKISETEILFKVLNLKRKITSSDIEEKSGFGLDNLKRRLELAYPDKFSLEVKDNENEYITNLKIEINNEN